MTPSAIHRRFFFNFFFQFASIGVFLPFFAIFLKDKGFTGTQIATIMMSVPLVQLFANPFYGYIADTRLPRQTLYRVALSGTIALCAGFYFIETFWACFLFIAVYSFFRMPKISILNAALFEHLDHTRGNYARIRIGGSVGFILFAQVTGFWVELHGIGRLVDVLILALLGHVLVGWRIPVNAAAAPTEPSADNWRLFVTAPIWLLFLAGVFFSRMAEACYNVFFSVHLDTLGYSATAIGRFWSIGVISEVLILWISPAILRRWRLETVLVFSYAVSALRWLLTGTATEAAALATLQALHGITFGLFYVAAVDWAYRNSPKQLVTTGQGITNAVMFGLAGIAGSLSSGPVFDWGGGTAVFRYAAGLACLAILTGLAANARNRKIYAEQPLGADDDVQRRE